MNLRDNEFAVFENRNKRAENHPDLRGEASVVCPHCKKMIQLEMSCWAGVSSSGSKYINGKFRLPDPNSEYYKKKMESDAAQKAKYEREKSGDVEPPF